MVGQPGDEALQYLGTKRSLENAARLAGKIGRVEQDHVKTPTDDRPEKIALQHLDFVLDVVEQGVDGCTAHRGRVDVNGHDLAGPLRRKDRADAGAGAHVQHGSATQTLRVAEDPQGLREESPQRTRR